MEERIEDDIGKFIFIETFNEDLYSVILKERILKIVLEYFTYVESIEYFAIRYTLCFLVRFAFPRTNNRTENKFCSKWDNQIIGDL